MKLALFFNETYTFIHFNLLLERRTAQPDDQRVGDQLLFGFKQPKHGFAMSVAIVHGQQAREHLALEVGIS